MFFKRLAAMSIPLFMGVTAFAAPPASDRAETPEKATNLSEAFSALHAVSQWATTISEMAEQRAHSDLVKDYARSMATANANADARLRSVAEKAGVEITPLDPQTVEGKSLLDRAKAETTLLGSLEGDAFDKEYMTLVTNTQQSVIRLLKTSRTNAKNPEVKKFLDDMINTVQARLQKAQVVMAKVYGNTI